MARLIDADMTYRKLSHIMMQVLEHSDEEMNEAMKGYNPSSFVEGFHHAKERILKILDSQPTVDAVEVVHGRWWFDPDGMDWGIGAWKCSHCGCKNNNLSSRGNVNPYHFAGSKFCPQCGAKMGDEKK